MRPDLFRLRRSGAAGQLFTMARPRGGQWLDAEMAGLADAGIATLVSMLTDAEVTRLGLSGEAEAAQAAGLAFRRLATPEREVPGRSECLALAEELRGQLAAGTGVAIHCRSGIGRSSVLAATVLVLEGITPHEAWNVIAAARGLPVPDTPAQRDFILGLR